MPKDLTHESYLQRMHPMHPLFEVESDKVVQSLIKLYQKLYLEPKQKVVEHLREEINRLAKKRGEIAREQQSVGWENFGKKRKLFVLGNDALLHYSELSLTTPYYRPYGDKALKKLQSYLSQMWLEKSGLQRTFEEGDNVRVHVALITSDTLVAVYNSTKGKTAEDFLNDPNLRLFTHHGKRYGHIAFIPRIKSYVDRVVNTLCIDNQHVPKATLEQFAAKEIANKNIFLVQHVTRRDAGSETWEEGNCFYTIITKQNVPPISEKTRARDIVTWGLVSNLHTLPDNGLHLNMIHTEAVNIPSTLLKAAEYWARAIQFSGNDVNQLYDALARCAHLLIDKCPWQNGTAAIVRWIVTSVAQFHGYHPAYRPKYRLDVMPLLDYDPREFIAHFPSYFEEGSFNHDPKKDCKHVFRKEMEEPLVYLYQILGIQKGPGFFNKIQLVDKLDQRMLDALKEVKSVLQEGKHDLNEVAQLMGEPRAKNNKQKQKRRSTLKEMIAKPFDEKFSDHAAFEPAFYQKVMFLVIHLDFVLAQYDSRSHDVAGAEAAKNAVMPAQAGNHP